MINYLSVYLPEYEWENPWFFLLLQNDKYFFASMKPTPIFICQAINYNIYVIGDYNLSLNFTFSLFYKLLNKTGISFFTWWVDDFSFSA